MAKAKQADLFAKWDIPDKPDYQIEAKYASNGPVIGIDEAGRGPLAGPVTIAAFWINPVSQRHLPEKLTDSKKLSHHQRKDIETQLCHPDFCHLWSVIHIDVKDIDSLGILQATFKGMQEVAADLAAQLTEKIDQRPFTALIDGPLTPQAECRCIAVTKGDRRSLSIAAASVLAKQSRDRLMGELAQIYPDYGWQNNAGYGTKAHLDALKQFGVTQHHRTSFAPVKKHLA